MPFANLKMQSLLYDVSQKRPEFNIREGIFYNGIENYSIKIAHKDNRTNLLRDIKIYRIIFIKIQKRGELTPR